MAGASCPCEVVKPGAGLLAGCAYTASWSRAVFGGDFGVVAASALHGNAPPLPTLLLAVWAVCAVTGGRWCYQGIRAALGHDDPFDGRALALSVGLVLFAMYALHHEWVFPWSREWGAWPYIASRGLYFVAIAYGVAGAGLQLRAPVVRLLQAQPRWQPPPPQWPEPRWDAPPQSPPPVDTAKYEEIIAAVARKADEDAHALAATWGQAVAERDRAIAALTDERNRFADDLMHAQATRDRYQTNGKRIAAEKRELEALARDLTAVLQFPGMRPAMLAAQHPDRGKTEAEKRARTVRFQKVGDVFDRLEKKGRA